VLGGLGGNTQSTRIEVYGSVGRINPNNLSCTIMVSENINFGIGESQMGCFIKVCGSVGTEFRKGRRTPDIAPRLRKNSVILIGGDVYGNIGKDMEVARIYVWGRVHGEIKASDYEGGFIYLNKKSAPLLKRITQSLGGKIGVKYLPLKESGYLFAEGHDDLADLIV
jgi:formylmethanofuran dehydrogenase subunit C